MTMSLERAKGFFSRSDKLALGAASSFCGGGRFRTCQMDWDWDLCEMYSSDCGVDTSCTKRRAGAFPPPPPAIASVIGYKA
jgi:hypothetical protein